MTIPWQMNCAHKAGSWCLDCVGKLGHEVERLRNLLSQILGDDGPDLDAYLDGHVAAPSVPALEIDNAKLREAFAAKWERAPLRSVPKPLPTGVPGPEPWADGECDDCRGTGRRLEDHDGRSGYGPCKTCNGTGQL